MVFSSHLFVFYFLLLSLAGYYLAPKALRHLVLTLLSYAFYGWWNPWFMLLMLGSTAIDYWCGLIISKPGAPAGRRRLGLVLSVSSNLLVLGFFKYCGFAVGAAGDVAQALGFGTLHGPEWVSRIVLPVGISFYVFQSMSYCIDLYRGHAPPAKSFIDFACYVSLYPQLVAGPIVRYGSLAHQLQHREHTVPAFALGVARFCLGFSKKILLADPCGQLADAAFQAGPGSLSAMAAWLGVTAYAFQIYFDFSAYSDMAIGLGRLFGFRFIENFNSPYQSASITEFWRRWHISLSTFLRDYLYIPLGGNRKGAGRTYVNLLTVMVLGGLWHGAQWTFVAWGLIHGLMLALERKLGKDAWYAALPHPVRVGLTFGILLATWVFFRAENFNVAVQYLTAMCGAGGTDATAGLLQAEMRTPSALAFLAVSAVIIWAVPNSQKLLEHFTLWKAVVCLLLFVGSLAVMFQQGYSPFLYFQF
ncbi:MAG: MBOAT family protein [Verrucomicrobiales bacterium]|nr:MBOAT family protein [Verrucomicrobiales bacterium]